MTLRFDNQVAVITGAGGGLGRAYALLLAGLGAKVVINDLGGTVNGSGSSTSAADKVVQEIKSAGGVAVANYDSVEFGEKIIQTAIDNFGRVDIVINNAGILRDKSFIKMTDDDWDLVQKVHVYGAFRVTKAAWDHFQKQKYGRIIMTASAAGIYGNYGQANYGSAKLALYGFGRSLAKEGARKNIHCNIIAPLAGSRITETVMPANLLAALKPEMVAPFVAYLCHSDCKETGSLFELGAGYCAKVRLERSPGVLLKVDDPSFTADAARFVLPKASDFKTDVQYPDSMTEVDWTGLVKQSKSLPKANEQGKDEKIRFDGQVVLVTGAGGGLGKGYALQFAKLGAKVVVNDFSKEAADKVVQEIIKSGGSASADYNSVEAGDAIISGIISKYGRIDVIVNNAGILRDKSFVKMTDAEWKAVQGTHLRGTYKVTKAAWPHFMKQGYGRVINTASAVGLYGNFGQTNYSAAKAGIWGLSSTLAIEGKKFNILVNTIAPNAGTAMTATILPSEIVEELKPDYVAPLVVALGHKSCPVSGKVYEVGSGWIASVRWQRSDGAVLNHATIPTVDQVAASWREVIDFTGKKPEYPTTTQESFSKIMNLTKIASGGGSSYNSVKSETKFNYGKKEVILYNLGIGCQADELGWVYENSKDFGVIPSFAVIPAFAGMMSVDMNSILNDFSPVMLLHGEQYIELTEGKLPVEGALTSTTEVVQVAEKTGKGTVVVAQVTTKDSKGNVVAISEGTTFNRKARAKKSINGKRRPLAMESPQIPVNRSPDAVKKQKVADNAAAIYRLSGDANPLHIDPKFAGAAGFPRPILHGLCTMGMATHHVIQAFPCKLVKAIKVRFVKHVFPGEEIETQMWRISPTRIVLQVRAVERNEIVISGAFVEFLDVSQESTKTETKVESKGTAPKASAFFKKMSEGYEKLPDAFKNDQVKKVGGVFVFNVNGSNFFIDLKNGKGQVGVGTSPQPADITILVSDDDFEALASGKMKGQAAFLKGLVKIKGNMMLAMKLDSVFKSFASLSSSKL